MVGEGEPMNWAKENIPDHSLLYMRVHEMWRSNGGVSPGAFGNHNAGMSTDWDEYSTPEETRDRARKPAKNAVVGMVVRDVREVPGQRVEHTPDVETDNRAHTDVFGEKVQKTQVKLRRIATIVIPFYAPAD